MRRCTLSIILLGLVAGGAEARLFWQTYGATVTAHDGCAWNIDQDYFVPRTCDAGRYALLSPCKCDHGTSPACRRLHPVYTGYCTPYGACHYSWRDCVYRSHCGCTPLRVQDDDGRSMKCRKPCYVLRDPYSCGDKSNGQVTPTLGIGVSAGCIAAGVLANVEPVAIEEDPLGSIAALPSAMGRYGMPGQPAGVVPSMPSSMPTGGPRPGLGGGVMPGRGGY